MLEKLTKRIGGLINSIMSTGTNMLLAAVIAGFLFATAVIVYDELFNKPKPNYPVFHMPIEAAIPKNPAYLPNAPRIYRNGIHEGIDLAAKEGTPVRAARAGKVIEVTQDELYGLKLTLTHKFGPWYKPQEWKTVYAHLSEIYVRKGQKVDSGQIIAKTGCTGSCVEPHLHFEIRKPDGSFLGKGYSELELQLLLWKYIR